MNAFNILVGDLEKTLRYYEWQMVSLFARVTKTSAHSHFYNETMAHELHKMDDVLGGARSPGSARHPSQCSCVSAQPNITTTGKKG